MTEQTQAVDLLGDPLPEPLPEGIRFNDLEQLVGHTIKGAFESRADWHSPGLILVTDTNCWIVIDADDEDGPYAKVDSYFGGPSYPITYYVHPDDLLRESCITKAEHDVVVAKEAEEKRQRDQARADRLRAELRSLEGQSSNGSR